MKIHPTAIVDPKANIGANVIIGPYNLIGPNVTIGDNTETGANVIIEGFVSIGCNNTISHHITIGTPPQDKAYNGEDTKVQIGNNNVIREFVSIHRASTKDRWKTEIGDNNFIMSYSHVGHDCVIGNNIVMANGIGLSGHCVVEDYANIGGMSGFHQFVRMGSYCMVGAMTAVGKDVPPFVIAAGPAHKSKLYGLNTVGLKRNNFSKEQIDTLSKAYQYLWKSNYIFEDAKKKVIEELGSDPNVIRLIKFLNESKRGVMR